ncbi:MAG TPA: hypothetical protein VIY51_20060 [Xanthobacteraceae bacterium]
MRFRDSIGAITLLATFTFTLAVAQAFDDSKYPDLGGQWQRVGNAGLLAGGAGGLRWDDSKPAKNTPSLGQEPPLTPEYQALYDANLADMTEGGQGIDPTYACLSPGMPRVMIGYSRFEIVVTPGTTYILMDRDHDHYRHIYTDGREFPADMAEFPLYLGYSIGKWRDESGSGRFDTLEVETRGLKGPRVFDATGIPLHADNETVIKERIHLDRADANLLHDDITTIDHALTRPWLVEKTFRRVKSDKPIWFGHAVCNEGNVHVGIGKEVYYLSADGLLMPAKKDQPPPDLRYFKRYAR